MFRKTILTLGLTFLLSLLVLFLLVPRGIGPAGRAGAASPDSSFSAPYNISNSSTEPNSQHPRILASNSGVLHAAWMEGNDGSYGAAYTKGQATLWDVWEWIGPERNPAYANPAIAIDGQGTIHAVWTSGASKPYDILYAYKPAGGAWSAAENISLALGAGRDSSFYPDIGLDSQGQIWVAWQMALTPENSEIYVRSRPAGGSWSAIAKVSTSAGQDLNVSLAIGPDNVPHLVWRSATGASAKYEIMYAKYAGGAWSAPLNISGTANSHSYFPDLVADRSGNLFVTWDDEIGGSENPQILFRRWDGTQWLPYRQVSNSVKAIRSAVAADNACFVYAVWQDHRDVAEEIYFSHSTDCGTTWLGDENVSRNGSRSYWPEIAAQAGGYAHIVWQDMAPGQLDIYYSQAIVEGGVPPTTTPVPTTVAPTPAVPYGSVGVVAQDPAGSITYTRRLTVTLNLDAASPAGHALEMRYDNYSDFHANPGFVALAPAVPNWRLLGPPQSCGLQTVYAQFRDAVDGTLSAIYSDAILFDDYLLTSMALNGGRPYTNRTMVWVGAEDLDLKAGCSGLEAVQLSQDGINYTNWFTYFPSGMYYVLEPNGPLTRTVYARYRDRAGNQGLYTDQIALDLIPPYNGRPPSLPPSTTHLLVTVGGLQASDDESGVANVWLANNCRPDGGGEWMALPYCPNPPCSYSWNLAYGGPPRQSPAVHIVCVKYEDGSGYDYYPGNFSPIYTGTITISGIRSAFLPTIARRSAGGALILPRPAPPDGPGLFLWTGSPPAGPGQDILLYLVAQPGLSAAQEALLSMRLPAGLQVVQAWSAYGTLLQVGQREVISLERLQPNRASWILVQLRVQPGAAPPLTVEGKLSGASETLWAPPLTLRTRAGP